MHCCCEICCKSTAVWDLPDIRTIRSTGADWFGQLISELDDTKRLRVMMLFWRLWHVRNELVHSKPAPPIEVSVIFFCSYIDALFSLAVDPKYDPIKGNAPISTIFPHVNPTCTIGGANTCVIPWSRPVLGRVIYCRKNHI